MQKPKERAEDTKYAGVKKLPEGGWYLRVTAIDPKTQQKREREGKVEAANAEAAFSIRQQWKDELTRVKEKAPEVTLTACAQAWLKQCVTDNESQATLDKKTDFLEQHILPVLGSYLLVKLERADLREWVRQASSKTYVPAKNKELKAKTAAIHYSEDTVRGWWRTLQALLTWAVDEYGLNFNPGQGMDVDRYLNKSLRQSVQKAKGVNSLTPEELPVFLKATALHFPDWHVMGVWGFLCGMRWSELSALNFNTSFDTAVREAIVRNTQVRGVTRDRTKAGEDRRIPYAQFMWDLLQAHRAKLIRDQAPGVETGLCFPSVVGSFRATSAFPFDEICAKAGIAKRLSSKCFRRTYEDLMRRSKVDAVVKRSMIGHSDERMSATYGTVHTEERHAALASILPLAGFQKTSKG